MDALSILMMLVWISMLVMWFLQHDKRPNGKTRGVFAMKEPEGGARAAGGPARQSGGHKGIALQRARPAPPAPRSDHLTKGAAAPGDAPPFHPEYR